MHADRNSALAVRSIDAHDSVATRALPIAHVDLGDGTDF
jgi:hypothetical protein